MTKTVGVEIARRGVTVNAVAPGFIETEMTEDLPAGVLDAVPARRPGGPGEGAAPGRRHRRAARAASLRRRRQPPRPHRARGSGPRRPPRGAAPATMRRPWRAVSS